MHEQRRSLPESDAAGSLKQVLDQFEPAGDYWNDPSSAPPDIHLTAIQVRGSLPPA